MEKSEVSDTDAPAIRQTIHDSSLRAFLFAARRGEARRARPGVRCTLEVTFVYRRTIAAARMPCVCRSTWFSRIRHTSPAWRIRRASRAEIFRALYVHTPSIHIPRAMHRVNPRWRNGVKELNRLFKVIDRPTNSLMYSVR